MMRLGGLSILFTVLFTFSVQASATYDDSGAFVKALGDRAINLLTQSKVSDEQQETRFRLLLREGFAVDKIGRFVLGKYRRKATSEELDEFLKLFEDYIVSLYSSAFRNYSGETFAVSRVVKTRSARDTMVVTHINPETDPNPTKVVFQVRNSKDVYKILDVKIQGVSMIVTQRDEFTGFIRNNGGKVSALITALRKKTEALKTRAK
ncbi:MAG: ABC transporter substrate-binding protein [Pseudomonadota bacterium]|jgi:phospholipid transport system substrate-binding protein|nr:ABC transporter substrate-binding protein [Pseudomonadota bacterium]|tara:strand:- start:57 stop:677 length:621 start_codon:yes stop_codon:yes gene_type:complete